MSSIEVSSIGLCKGTAFLIYPKIVGCGKKRVVEKFGLRNADLEL